MTLSSPTACIACQENLLFREELFWPGDEQTWIMIEWGIILQYTRLCEQSLARHAWCGCGRVINTPQWAGPLGVVTARWLRRDCTPSSELPCDLRSLSKRETCACNAMPHIYAFCALFQVSLSNICRFSWRTFVTCCRIVTPLPRIRGLHATYSGFHELQAWNMCMPQNVMILDSLIPTANTPVSWTEVEPSILLYVARNS